MSRSRRASFGSFAFAIACACSSEQPSASSGAAQGGSSSTPSAGGVAASTAGAGAATGGAAAGGGAPSAGGALAGSAPSSLAGSADVATSAGAGGARESGERSIFYLDVQGSVLGFDEAERTPRTLVRSAGQGPDGIAVDVAGGHIFWTTMGVPADDDGSLRRANLDGSEVTTIVAEGGSYTPKQLKLDAAGQKLYWSDREGMRIQRASLDGSSVETLVTVATGATARKNAENWCVGLALDLEHGFVYWTQKGPDNGMVGSIRRAQLELAAGETAATRSDIEVLFTGLPEPVDLDLDVSNGYMYWTDRGDDTINRAPIEIPSGESASTRADREVIVKNVREAIGITLDLERGHVYYTGAVNGRVGRANLDGSGALDLVTGMGALTGIAVVQLTTR
jgi:hypothetical protein